MGLLTFLRSRRKETEADGDFLNLTVLYFWARDGLQADDGFAVRNLILDSGSLFFQFLNPGAFCIFFSDADEGKNNGARLSRAMKKYAHEHQIQPVGVGVCVGRCIVSFDKEGRIKALPIGGVINDAAKSAYLDACSHGAV
jgi:hypothetical protein